MDTSRPLLVDLGDRSYPIHIGAGLLADGSLLPGWIGGNQACIVTNETVGPLYLEAVKAACGNARVDVVELPDGERHKTLSTLETVFDTLLRNRHGRGTTLIALGGGVVGDMTGFAAASYQRGVSFVQIPTTLLAQVDSSVGGKTGVNHPLGKNMIGAFHQPKAVLIDTDLLASLPGRELGAGLAEVIKYGCIRDAGFLDWLEANTAPLLDRDPDALQYAIRRSCEIKAEVVAEDEREADVRAILNFGHTFGHAIETHTEYVGWLHGEAVATGMVMAADLSARMGMIPGEDAQRVRRVIAGFGLPVLPPQDLDPDTFLSHMAVDKKVQDGQLRLILLAALGRAEVVGSPPEDALRATLGARESLCGNETA